MTYHDPIERVADWLRLPSLPSSPGVTLQDVLMLVRPPDHRSVNHALSGGISIPIRAIYGWERMRPLSGFEYRVMLVVDEQGSLIAFCMPQRICGATLEFVRDRFSDSEWRRSMGLEPPDINEVVTDQVESAYRERQKRRAEVYGGSPEAA